MDSYDWYLIVLAFFYMERLFEIWLSQRHEKKILALGGLEVGQSHYPYMVVLHICFLIACPFEVFMLNRSFHFSMAMPMGVLLGISMILRYWTIITLGIHWNTKILLLPGKNVVSTGPFRFIRHPNYLAVVIEIFALPLLHGAWVSAVIFSILNFFMLKTRISVEEKYLERYMNDGPKKVTYSVKSMAPWKKSC